MRVDPDLGPHCFSQDDFPSSESAFVVFICAATFYVLLFFVLFCFCFLLLFFLLFTLFSANPFVVTTCAAMFILFY